MCNWNHLLHPLAAQNKMVSLFKSIKLCTPRMAGNPFPSLLTLSVCNTLKKPRGLTQITSKKIHLTARRNCSLPLYSIYSFTVELLKQGIHQILFSCQKKCYRGWSPWPKSWRSRPILHQSQWFNSSPLPWRITNESEVHYQVGSRLSECSMNENIFSSQCLAHTGCIKHQCYKSCASKSSSC